MTWLFLTLAACERDPTLLGYWEVASMRAGTNADALDEVTKAGFVEFQSNNDAYAMFSYTWSGAWVPDERPDLVNYGTDIIVDGDFVESYKEQGETYTVTLTGPGAAVNLFAIEDWKGSTVTLESDAAYPPGTDETAGQGVIWELSLER